MKAFRRIIRAVKAIGTLVKAYRKRNGTQVKAHRRKVVAYDRNGKRKPAKRVAQRRIHGTHHSTNR